LLASYLQRSAGQPVEAISEVEPYQAQPALGLDLATAWRDALLPGVLLGETTPARVGFPEAWQQARTHTWASPFPCCIGLAPQFLQQIQPLMRDARQFFQRPADQAAPTSWELPAELPWLSRLAAARIAGDVRGATQLLTDAGHPDHLVQNERAAQAWLQDDRKTASRLWNKLPGDQPVIAFNQALAALHQGEVKTGVEKLRLASAGFDESTGWRHLAELYRVALGD
jgi:hypothetical protein